MRSLRLSLCQCYRHSDSRLPVVWEAEASVESLSLVAFLHRYQLPVGVNPRLVQDVCHFMRVCILKQTVVGNMQVMAHIRDVPRLLSATTRLAFPMMSVNLVDIPAHTNLHVSWLQKRLPRPRSANTTYRRWNGLFRLFAHCLCAVFVRANIVNTQSVVIPPMSTVSVYHFVSFIRVIMVIDFLAAYAALVDCHTSSVVKNCMYYTKLFFFASELSTVLGKPFLKKCT